MRINLKIKLNLFKIKIIIKFEILSRLVVGSNGVIEYN